MQRKKRLSLKQEIALRGVVWALVGVIFGFLFVLLLEFVRIFVEPPYVFAVAAIGGAALTALFYGSMRLTVLVANFTFVAMLGYVWQAGTPLVIEPLVFIGAGVGLAVGALYGLKDKRSRVYCAEAKIIAGAVSGILGGVLATGLAWLLPAIPVGAVAMVVAPVSVLAYVRLSGWFISRCQHFLPPFVDGAVVGLGVGSVTGLLFLIMAGTLDPKLLAGAELRAFVGRFEAGWGLAVLGCALVCFPIGAVRAWLGIPWYDK
jgi:hypothetical protein